MPNYAFTAVSPKGSLTTGRVAASDVRAACALLQARGLHPTELSEEGTAEASRSGSPPPWGVTRGWWRGRRLPPKALALFTRQLATMMRAGLPLARSLEVLARQGTGREGRELVAGLAAELKSGRTFSEVIAVHPREFSRLYVSMVRAGEAGGALDIVLDRIARFQEKTQQLKSRMTTALVYPVVVLLVAAGILGGLLVFVVPRFQAIFSDLLKGAPLPPLTQAVLAFSEGARHHGLVLLGAGLLCGATGKFVLASSSGRLLADRWLLQVPVFGELLRRSVIARFTRTLGTLLASGVPILPALATAREACGNAWVARAISTVHERVKEGAPFAQPLAENPVFPPMLASMVDVGEQTGQLAEMLGKVADIHEEEVDTAVAGLSSLVEPLLIVFLALVVGTIVLALFLPIIRIVQLMT